jgi:hypothetical protein
MHVAGLWRYPVKSMSGEALEAADIGPSGLAGDRQYGVVRVANGRVLSAKREPQLLYARAELSEGLRITLPTGDVIRELGREADEVLSGWLGYAVRLATPDPGVVPTFETQADFFDDSSRTATWNGVAGSWVDSKPVHLLTTAALRQMKAERPELDWSVERFRPNILLDADDDLPDRRADLTVGEVDLRLDKPCSRCVMVTRAQPRARGGDDGLLARQVDVLRHLVRTRDTNLGVLAGVLEAGRVRLGARCRVSTAQG